MPFSHNSQPLVEEALLVPSSSESVLLKLSPMLVISELLVLDSQSFLHFFGLGELQSDEFSSSDAHVFLRFCAIERWWKETALVP